MKVFISHSFEDKNVFDDMCHALEQSRLPYWNPKKMPAGTSLRDKLKAAIKECSVCIFIATQKSLDSGWCQAELGAFWGTNKPVIVYKADESISENKLPVQFKGDIYAVRFREVISSVKSHLEDIIDKGGGEHFVLDDYTILVGPPMKLEGIDLSEVTWDKNNCYIIGPNIQENISLEPSRIGNSFIIRLQKPILNKILKRKVHIALNLKDTKGNRWKTAPISLIENFVYLRLSKEA